MPRKKGPAPEPAPEVRKSPAAHLAGHRFKPGTSGNPGGRPKGRSITAVIRELLDSPIAGDGDARPAVERIGEAVLKRAIAGDLEALGVLLERTEGPGEAAQAVVGNQVCIYLPSNGRDRPDHGGDRREDRAPAGPPGSVPPDLG